MDTYLDANTAYWQQGYEAENVESFVFRPYGRIFKAQLGIDGSKGEKLLDFGCGAGAALEFFKRKGFDVYGVDISIPDIARCRQRMPDIADHFAVIDAKPRADNVFFGGEFDMIIGIQSLYYFTLTDFKTLMASLYNQMRPGGIIYASMIGTRCWYYAHSIEHEDGLREVRVSTKRLRIDKYYIQFTQSEEVLIQKFSLFKRLHVGYYDAQFREDEGSDFHYTFIGQKI